MSVQVCWRSRQDQKLSKMMTLVQTSSNALTTRPNSLLRGGMLAVPRPLVNSRSLLRQSNALQPEIRGHSVVTQAFNTPNKIDPADRVVACLPYLLPLLDAIPFGKFIFLQMPFVARAMAPLGPLAALYNGIPFAPFIIFLAVYQGVVANQSMSRFVRFNAMQAVLLDVLLIIPQVIMSSVFRNPGNDALSLQLYINAYNTIFLFVAISVAYGMGSALVGQTARLPLVAEAADSQLGRSGF